MSGRHLSFVSLSLEFCFLMLHLKNQLASLWDSESERLALSCLCNNNTIIIFTQNPTPLPLVYCSLNQWLIPPNPPWSWLHYIWVDSNLERCYQSLIKINKLKKTTHNCWLDLSFRISEVGTFENEFLLEDIVRACKMCSIFPLLLAQFDVGVHLCGLENVCKN